MCGGHNDFLNEVAGSSSARIPQLHRVGLAEIAAVAAGTKRPHAPSPKAAPKKPTPQPSTAGKSNQPSLASEIVAVIRSASRPLTAKHLAQEVKRRGFKTTSADFTKVVETRLWDLKKRGLVQRAADQTGYTLAPSANGPAPKAGVAKAASPRTPAKTAKRGALAASTGPSATGGKAANRLPLHVLLTQILQKQSRPMTGGELAQEALKAGYLTSSKNFAQSVWTALGLMKNVENVKGQGYRLKRGKS